MSLQIRLVTIFLLLFSSTGLTKSSNELKIFTTEYETIIHLDSTDYQIYHRLYHPMETIRGISAGENYLILWDFHNAFVFDIDSYQLLARIRHKYRPASVAEYDGKIFYISGQRLMIYNTFDKYETYILNSVFTSLSDYQNFINSASVRRWPRKPQKVTQLIYQNQSLYLVFENRNFLDFKKDMVIEKDCSGRKYLFPQKILPPRPRKFVRKFLGDAGKVIAIDSPTAQSPYLLTFSDREEKLIKGLKINRPALDEKNGAKFGIDFIFEDDNMLYIYGEITFDSTIVKRKGKIIKFDQFSKTASEIDLPMRNLYNMTNASYYYAYANKTFYQIAINSDLSVDVLKVDLSRFDDK